VNSQLYITITGTKPLQGIAQRFGFELPWSARPDGDGWLVEVPRGHSLGLDGKGAFEIVTAGDWQSFVNAVMCRISQLGDM